MSRGPVNKISSTRVVSTPVLLGIGLRTSAQKLNIRIIRAEDPNSSSPRMTVSQIIQGHQSGQRDFKGICLEGNKDFGAVNLSGSNFKAADLSGANFEKTILREVDFRKTNLNGANLRGATLYKANLRSADLGNADLKYALLEGADFTGADVEGIEIKGAWINLDALLTLNGGEWGQYSKQEEKIDAWKAKGGNFIT